MCISSNSVNQAQDLMSVTKIEDFPNSLLPSLYMSQMLYAGQSDRQDVTFFSDF